MDDHHGRLLAKYSRRGWKFQPHLWPEEFKTSALAVSERRIGDRLTWTIPFDTHGVETPRTPDTVAEYASFSVRNLGQPEGPNEQHCRVAVSEFKAHTLMHKYTASPKWCKFLGHRIDCLTKQELFKIAQRDRPSLLAGSKSLYRLRLTNPKPDSWSYFDESIPMWYQAFETALIEQPQLNILDSCW